MIQYLIHLQHKSNFSRSCFIYIRDIHSFLNFAQLAWLPPQLFLQQWTSATLTLMLTINSTPQKIAYLKAIQNAMARTVTWIPMAYHITSGLKSRHWFRVPEQIHFKILCLPSSFHNPYTTSIISLIQTQWSTYLSSSLTFVWPTASSLTFSDRLISYNCT